MSSTIDKKELAAWLKENPQATAKEIQKHFLEKDKPTSELLGMWAKHEECGDVVITSHVPYNNGDVHASWINPSGPRVCCFGRLKLSDLEFPHLYTQPKEIPDGEAWVVGYRKENRHIGRCNGIKFGGDSWFICDGNHHDTLLDDDITLIQPLTPERPVSAPRTVTTEEEYAALPEGSVVLRAGHRPLVKIHMDSWLETSPTPRVSDQEISGTPREVLREGWGE